MRNLKTKLLSFLPLIILLAFAGNSYASGVPQKIITLTGFSKYIVIAKCLEVKRVKGTSKNNWSELSAKLQIERILKAPKNEKNKKIITVYCRTTTATRFYFKPKGRFLVFVAPNGTSENLGSHIEILKDDKLAWNHWELIRLSEKTKTGKALIKEVTDILAGKYNAKLLKAATDKNTAPIDRNKAALDLYYLDPKAGQKILENIVRNGGGSYYEYCFLTLKNRVPFFFKLAQDKNFSEYKKSILLHYLAENKIVDPLIKANQKIIFRILDQDLKDKRLNISHVLVGEFLLRNKVYNKRVAQIVTDTIEKVPYDKYFPSTQLLMFIHHTKDPTLTPQAWSILEKVQNSKIKRGYCITYRLFRSSPSPDAPKLSAKEFIDKIIKIHPQLKGKISKTITISSKVFMLTKPDKNGIQHIYAIGYGVYSARKNGKPITVTKLRTIKLI